MIDFSQGGYSGASSGITDTLLDGYSGWDSVNPIHIRSLQDLDILSHIRGQALKIPALPFCKQNIKNKRRFPGPGYPGDHYQLMPGDGYTQFFEIVFTGPGYMNG